jgi:hypothetical protein
MFLVFVDETKQSLPEFVKRNNGRRVAESLYFFKTTKSRSRLYHDLKEHICEDSTLVVLKMSEPAKMKNVTAGSVKWMKSYFS